MSFKFILHGNLFLNNLVVDFVFDMVARQHFLKYEYCDHV